MSDSNTSLLCATGTQSIVSTQRQSGLWARLFATGAWAALALSGLSAEASAQELTLPNILYIVSDDMGWKDVGFHGSDIKTPNLDSLAETGVEFLQFYAQPMCTPTRAALMTGRYPLRYGMQTAVIPSGGLYGLATDEWLLPQALKEVGYDTAMVGKWHIGHADPEFWPRQRGFDHFYGALVGEIDHFKHESHGVVDWYRDNEVVEEEGYDTTLFGDEAVRLINEQDPETPLFLYLAFTAPHTPYQAPQEYLDKYATVPDELRRAYAAMINAMDVQIGRVLDALDERNMAENTLVIFHSDNGGTRDAKFTGESAVVGELPPNNGPYRDGKGTLYEGGTRVVALANWPGRIEPGKVAGMVHVVDMFPTLAGLTGARSPTASRWTDWTSGLSSARASRRRARRSSTTSSRSEPPCARATGSWLGWRCCRLRWSSSTCRRTHRRQPIWRTRIPRRSRSCKTRIEALAQEAVPPLFIADVMRQAMHAPPSTPDMYFLNSD